MLYPRYNRIYWGLVFVSWLLFIAIGIILVIKAYSSYLDTDFDLWLYSLTTISLANLFTICGLFLWERQKRFQEPRYQIQFNLLKKILTNNNSCLLVRNKSNHIIWSSNWEFIKTALANKRTHLFNLIRIPQIGFRIPDLKVGQALIFTQPTAFAAKLQYKLILLEPQLFLLISLTKQHLTEQFYIRHKSLFLVIAVDKINPSFPGQDFVQLENKILNEIQKYFNNRLVNDNVVIVNATRYEWIFMIGMQQLQNFCNQEFSFLRDVETIIEKQHNVSITFSAGTYSGFQNLFADESSLIFNNFALLHMYRKAFDAKRMAQARGGDQIIITDVENSFTVYGQQRVGSENKNLDSLLKNFKLNFLNKTQKYPKIVLLGHKYPDFDVFGAALAMKSFLEKHYETEKEIFFLVTQAAPSTLKFVKNEMTPIQYREQIIFNSKRLLPRFHQSDTLLVIVDTNNPEYVDFPDPKWQHYDKIYIDHHLEYFKGDPILKLIDNNFSSASEIVLNLMIQTKKQSINYHYDKNVFSLILAGILMDTKNLQTQIGAKTLETVNFLIKNSDVNMERMILKINRFKNQTTPIISLKPTDFKVMTISSTTVILRFNEKYFVSAEMVAALAEQYLANQKAEFVFALGNDQNQDIFLSGRSRAPYNVEVICKQFNGGGDSRRAAAKLTPKETTLVAATQKLQTILSKNKQ